MHEEEQAGVGGGYQTPYSKSTKATDTTNEGRNEWLTPTEVTARVFEISRVAPFLSLPHKRDTERQTTRATRPTTAHPAYSHCLSDSLLVRPQQWNKVWYTDRPPFTAPPQLYFLALSLLSLAHPPGWSACSARGCPPIRAPLDICHSAYTTIPDDIMRPRRDRLHLSCSSLTACARHGRSPSIPEGIHPIHTDGRGVGQARDDPLVPALVPVALNH